ncbi:hypothetical protein B0H65DRAFT_440897 [Neurospora tetraspora]|uniref:Uncharacterized protein n=1 Tax=Neurospora tetraspora TaxID=94610 RepID=A0AAE0JLV3_9PEZI|nr:hypothetical protein B0H65DRAFT_440897 [Neurospora tetraspora]
MPPTEQAFLTAREALRLTLSEREGDLAHAFANYPDKVAWLAHFIECLDRSKKGPFPEQHVLKSDVEAGYIFRGPVTFRVDVQQTEKSHAEATLEVHGRTKIHVEKIPEWAGYEIIPSRHLLRHHEDWLRVMRRTE